MWLLYLLRRLTGVCAESVRVESEFIAILQEIDRQNAELSALSSKISEVLDGVSSRQSMINDVPTFPPPVQEQ